MTNGGAPSGLRAFVASVGFENGGGGERERERERERGRERGERERGGSERESNGSWRWANNVRLAHESSAYSHGRRCDGSDASRGATQHPSKRRRTFEIRRSADSIFSGTVVIRYWDTVMIKD